MFSIFVQNRSIFRNVWGSLIHHIKKHHHHHHEKVRLLGASLSTTALLLYIGIVTYLPALALEQVIDLFVNYLFVYYLFTYQRSHWNRSIMSTKNVLPTVPLVQVTGIDINVACVTIFVVCVFYTTAGGFKAV